MKKDFPINSTLKTTAILLNFAAVLLGPVVCFSAQQQIDVDASAAFIPVTSVTVASVTTENSVSGVMVKFSASKEQPPAVSCYAGPQGSPVSCSDETFRDKTVIGTYL